MKRGQRLGLDELMIVNPAAPSEGTVFLGEDGVLYKVQGLGEEEDLKGLGQFFLGEDGTLYQGLGLRGSGEPEALPNEGMAEEDEGHQLGRFFLGEDGTLYEVVEKK
jgi:hypothetical protein